MGKIKSSSLILSFLLLVICTYLGFSIPAYKEIFSDIGADLNITQKLLIIPGKFVWISLGIIFSILITLKDVFIIDKPRKITNLIILILILVLIVFILFCSYQPNTGFLLKFIPHFDTGQE